MKISIKFWKDIQSMVDVQYEGRYPTQEQISSDYVTVHEFNIPDSIGHLNEDGFLINSGNEEIVPDDFFSKFNNGTNPLATPEGQRFIKENGVRHTSMSIGDIIEVEGLPYICDCEGWTRI